MRTGSLGLDDRDRRARPGGVRPLYGRFAWAYDLVVARPAGGTAEHVAKMLLSSGASPGSRVVDAGCGTGRYADVLAASGFRVIGVDRSEALIEQARARSSSAVFVCADLLAWRPPEMADAVLCRGVINDLTADSERRAAFGAFASWLCPGGLLADVRDWEATATRYAHEPRHEHSASRPGRTLKYSSETTLDASRCLMHVREHYAGTVDCGDEANDGVLARAEVHVQQSLGDDSPRLARAAHGAADRFEQPRVRQLGDDVEERDEPLLQAVVLYATSTAKRDRERLRGDTRVNPRKLGVPGRRRMGGLAPVGVMDDQRGVLLQPSHPLQRCVAVNRRQGAGCR